MAKTMNGRGWLVWAAGTAALAGALALPGCGKGGAEAGEAAKETAAALAQVAKTPREEARDALAGAFAAAKEGRLDALYGMLPASWQEDVSGLVAAYAGKVQPELAEAASGAVSALGKVLEAQAGHLTELAMRSELSFEWADPENGDAGTAAEIEAGIRALGGVLKECPGWLSAEELSKGDLSGILQSGVLQAGVRQMAAARTDWPEVRLPAEKDGSDEDDEDDAEDGEDDGDADLELEPGDVVLEVGDDGNGWERVAFRNVEGRWVPAEMIAGWESEMAEARRDAERFEIPGEMAALALQTLPALERAMGAWEGAASAEELQAQALGTVAMLGLLQLPQD